jgi:hypothetical protein
MPNDLVRRYRCPECGDFDLPGFVPVPYTSTVGVAAPAQMVALRPCSLCNVGRFTAWRRGQLPVRAGQGGYPKGYHGPRREGTRPEDHGQPTWVEATLSTAPAEFLAAVELSKEAMVLPPGSPERVRRVVEIEALADQLEADRRRRQAR